MAKMKAVILIASILLTAACQLDVPFPEQDCGAVSDVKIHGTVLDSNQLPVPNATVFLKSKKLNQCWNSISISDITLSTNEAGEFTTEIDVIAEDDILVLTVSAAGYQSVTLDYLSYADFSEGLEIIMTR